MDKLEEIYFSTEGFQVGSTAAKNLQKKVPELTRKEIQHWLDREPAYQIYKPKPRRVKYPHYNQSQPNHTHQIDLLILPNDGEYKYALTIVDIASRYKEAEPVKTKMATESSNAIQRIYDRSPLEYPKWIMCDKGREFMGAFTKLMNNNNVKVSRSLNKKHVAFVERFNRTLAEKLFIYQYKEEMDTKETNREWVARLPGVVEATNDEETRMIGMKPVDAIKLKKVPQPEYKEVPEDLPIDSIVRQI